MNFAQKATIANAVKYLQNDIELHSCRHSGFFILRQMG